MRHVKRTAATFFFAGALALGVAPAAGAATTPHAVSPAMAQSVASAKAVDAVTSGAQLRVPVYYQWECHRVPGKKAKKCGYVWYSESKPRDLKECYGGYGPICGARSDAPLESELL